jgi:hypothetical protein
MSAVVLDHTELLELAGGVGDAFTSDAEHVGDEFLSHDQLIGRQAVER